jgi:ferredoxin
MASKTQIWRNNAPGDFYVDEECIDCNLCSEIAPANFAVDPEGGHDFVARQPETGEERALCLEAKAACPVEAIGCDGAAA